MPGEEFPEVGEFGDLAADDEDVDAEAGDGGGDEAEVAVVELVEDAVEAEVDFLLVDGDGCGDIES